MFLERCLEVELLDPWLPVRNLPNCSIKTVHVFLTLTMFENHYFSVFLLLFLMLVYFDMISESIHFPLSHGEAVCVHCVKKKPDITSPSTTARSRLLRLPFGGRCRSPRVPLASGRPVASA